MHTQEKNLYSFIVEKKSTRMWRQGSKVISITVEDKSTKKMSLPYNKSWVFLSNSKGLITGRDINE